MSTMSDEMLVQLEFALVAQAQALTDARSFELAVGMLLLADSVAVELEDRHK